MHLMWVNYKAKEKFLYSEQDKFACEQDFTVERRKL